MTSQAEMVNDQAPGPDLIDQIANLLPAERRQEYYRVMVHLRMLPESDELLRILQAMGYLTLLIQQAPQQMAVQREQLSAILTSSLASIQETHSATIEYQDVLETRLSRLPEDIAKGIDPEIIAAKLAESVRQQFTATGLPETAKVLHTAASLIKETATQFKQSNASLAVSLNGLLAQATKSMGTFQSSLSSAVVDADHSMSQIRAAFLVEYKWSVASLTGIALVLGFAMGFWTRFDLEKPCPAPTVVESPVQAPATNQAQPREENRRKRGR